MKMYKIKNRRHHLSYFSGQKGFTVLELMIATTVFSVMLLLTTTGMIQIGKVYYKGLVTAKTQDTVRSISHLAPPPQLTLVVFRRMQSA